MNSDTSARDALRDMELQVEAEGREWMPRQLEQEIQAQVEDRGAIFPRSGRRAHHRRRERMRLRTASGPVEIRVWRGRNPANGRWGIPIRQRWGLSTHQQLSPALEDKLAYFATVAGSYESAARLARKTGIAIEGCTVHQLGGRAEEQTRQRLKTVPRPLHRQRLPSSLGLIMVDGFQVRHRRSDWGKKRAQKPRAEWPELLTGECQHRGRERSPLRRLPNLC